MKQFSFWLQDLILVILTFNFFIRKRIIKRYKTELNFRKVLDAGCGTGTLAPMFPKEKYYGIDIDRDLILYAKRKYKGYKFEVGNLTNFTSNEKFDLVLIVGVLHHLNDRDIGKFFNSLSRNLTNDARIIVIEAIFPLNKLNFVGYLLRYFDQGKFIRSTNEYKKLVKKKFRIIDCKLEREVFFDYVVFFASLDR